VRRRKAFVELSLCHCDYVKAMRCNLLTKKWHGIIIVKWSVNEVVVNEGQSLLKSAFLERVVVQKWLELVGFGSVRFGLGWVGIGSVGMGSIGMGSIGMGSIGMGLVWFVSRRLGLAWCGLSYLVRLGIE